MTNHRISPVNRVHSISHQFEQKKDVVESPKNAFEQPGKATKITQLIECVKHWCEYCTW